MLGLKRGVLDTERLQRKFGIDPLVEWSAQWRGLAADGYLEQIQPWPVLTRQGLLMVDSLLPRFFDADGPDGVLERSQPLVLPT